MLLMRTLRPQGSRPEENAGAKEAYPGHQTRGLNFNPSKSGFWPWLRRRDTGGGEVRGLLGWKQKERRRERALALGPAFCLGHCFQIQ